MEKGDKTIIAIISLIACIFVLCVVFPSMKSLLENYILLMITNRLW